VSAAAAIVTLSLTLGIGTAIVAVVDAVLLTPPPFANPDALVILGESPIEEPAAIRRPVPYATFEAWRERAGSLASLEAFDGTNLTLTGVAAAERLSANDVTPGFLSLLGATPALGRQFDADDVGRPVVIISDAFWRTKLAGDPAVIGREIALGGRAHSVIGVLAPQFSFGLNPSDVWRPLPLTEAQAARTGYRVIGIARLARQASATDVASRRQLRATRPSHYACWLVPLRLRHSSRSSTLPDCFSCGRSIDAESWRSGALWGHAGLQSRNS
jgi:hypothetical protein